MDFNLTLDIILNVCIFFIALGIGYWLNYWLTSKETRTGTMHVIVSEDKTTFSLELDENPETLVNKERIVFKVITSKVDSNNREKNFPYNRESI